MSGPQVKRREVWIELPDEYAGFRFKAWVNAPSKLWTQLGATAPEWAEPEERERVEDARFEAMNRLVLEHNGWLDFEGEAYPATTEAEFWEAIPTELAACILVALQAEMQKLPNSIQSRGRNSRRT